MLDNARRRGPAPGSPGLGEEIRIPAEDGRPLAASLFLPPGGQSATAPLTVIAGGTGIARRYYARLAAYLAQHGRPTVTFDYRETGGSRPESRHASLRRSQVRMRDWCILDAAGVIAWAAREHPGRLLHWVGHSLGGFATGLAHNNRLIARQLNIAALSGYWHHMAVPERYRVRVLMGAVAPLVIRVCGYFPGPLIGGEDMPGPAFLEWRRWCMQPGFLFDDPDLPETANFARLHAPIRFAQIEDDTWGTPTAVEAMARRFTGSTERTIWRIRLADAGARHIGHHGFFRSRMRHTLWPAALAWLDGKSAE
ncbi:MAG TPA: alpha/beta fold hydrolase [Hyphomicrobiaceae bacterium]|nr:alpha/beta fold hydrolase [Hyphomicrobiaceae bacterium]